MALDPQIATDTGIKSELAKYFNELKNFTPRHTNNPLWIYCLAIYPKLALVAEDIVTAPASQAVVERIFSICGMLTVRNRNRTQRSLEMRVSLKINRNL